MIETIIIESAGSQRMGTASIANAPRELFPVRVVYQFMFEQSLLCNEPGTKKTAAFAASLSAQIALTGVCILVPLIYQEGLPMVRQVMSLPVVLSKPPIVYEAGASGVWRRAAVHAGAMVLKSARWWSWPHRRIGRLLQRRGYRYLTAGLQPAVQAVR